VNALESPVSRIFSQWGGGPVRIKARVEPPTHLLQIILPRPNVSLQVPKFCDVGLRGVHSYRVEELE
jgi:hypothetical protein